MNRIIRKELGFIYGEENADALTRKVEELITTHAINAEKQKERFNEQDAFIITYGDSLTSRGEVPLSVLHRFFLKNLKETVRGIHILPYFPYSSDDGFSIIDYRKVNPELGNWDTIEAIAAQFRFMTDLVLNHCSAESEYVKGYLRGDSHYDNFFIAPPDDVDLSSVARPRTSPLLTPFRHTDGEIRLWTTFSADQVDLNFAEPNVLLEMTDILLEYMAHGARVVRLDAIAYLWKEIGTPCIHHPKTHAIVRFFRAVMEEVSPGSVLITETNVPHKENMSYLGTMNDEAHMIYQFSLPPLVLDAFIREDPRHLTEWAKELPHLGETATYFNFLASHDGIGILPAHGILEDNEIAGLLSEVKKRGGEISYKAVPGGEIPYELNINYLSAVAEDSLSAEARAAKFLASQAVLLSMPGVPGIYIHSLLGSQNWSEGPQITGMKRSINREKLDISVVEEELTGEDSLRRMVFEGYTNMLEARRKSKAFHPAGPWKVLDFADNGVFAIERNSPDKAEQVTVFINTTGKETDVSLGDVSVGVEGGYDLLAGDKPVENETIKNNRLRLEPFQSMWISKRT
jgi:glucosylglycerate phosphorylase